MSELINSIMKTTDYHCTMKLNIHLKKNNCRNSFDIYTYRKQKELKLIHERINKLHLNIKGSVSKLEHFIFKNIIYGKA